MRTFSLGIALAIALAACSAAPEDKVATAAPDDRIECATGGATDFTRACAVEKGEGTALILRHVDGGFRRIDLAPDGTITASDGSDEPVGKALPDGRFELTLGSDRYRLPQK
ncbi:hypothetical protein [Sphingomonas sp. SUN039]|uniref:hypothetical protein n=1 Tax=Sphingomonas sp. SUN039 TaxID=2937787 RepID=UPI00216496EC|nr:hypothetical protein [Sphingomonas sp. SUN039]UVO53876.1 hypothetical protein M0209_06980 [Sphingomonas sp. SUN039]